MTWRALFCQALRDGLLGLGAVGVGAALLGGLVSVLAASGRRR
jgi:hypothetical protein